MERIAIIHTTAVTIEPLKALAAEYLPGAGVINLMDDTILPQLGENGGNLQEIAERWRQYAKTAEARGAACILNACSSVGEIGAMVQDEIGVPIFRIDEPMAETAVQSDRVGVAATLATTLNPTLRLLKAKAGQAGRQVEFEPVVIASAYRKLLQGDAQGHDEDCLKALRELAERCDRIVLAQASMARIVAGMPESDQGRFLSSPRSGMQRVKQWMENRQEE